MTSESHVFVIVGHSRAEVDRKTADAMGKVAEVNYVRRARAQARPMPWQAIAQALGKPEAVLRRRYDRPGFP